MDKPVQNILLAVDVQRGFCQSEATKQLPKKVSELINTQLFDTVIATKFFNFDNSMFEKAMGWTAFKTEEEQELLVDCDFVIKKSGYGCVNSQFTHFLRSLEPFRIFLVGCDTDCCVLSIATELFENGIRPIVLSSYCASNGGKVSHLSGLTCLKRLIGEKQISDIELTNDSKLEQLENL